MYGEKADDPACVVLVLIQTEFRKPFRVSRSADGTERQLSKMYYYAENLYICTYI